MLTYKILLCVCVKGLCVCARMWTEAPVALVARRFSRTPFPVEPLPTIGQTLLSYCIYTQISHTGKNFTGACLYRETIIVAMPDQTRTPLPSSVPLPTSFAPLAPSHPEGCGVQGETAGGKNSLAKRTFGFRRISSGPPDWKRVLPFSLSLSLCPFRAFPPLFRAAIFRGKTPCPRRCIHGLHARLFSGDAECVSHVSHVKEKLNESSSGERGTRKLSVEKV